MRQSQHGTLHAWLVHPMHMQFIPTHAPPAGAAFHTRGYLKFVREEGHSKADGCRACRRISAGLKPKTSRKDKKGGEASLQPGKQQKGSHDLRSLRKERRAKCLECKHG